MKQQKCSQNREVLKSTLTLPYVRYGSRCIYHFASARALQMLRSMGNSAKGRARSQVSKKHPNQQKISPATNTWWTLYNEIAKIADLQTKMKIVACFPFYACILMIKVPEKEILRYQNYYLQKNCFSVTLRSWKSSSICPSSLMWWCQVSSFTMSWAPSSGWHWSLVRYGRIIEKWWQCADASASWAKVITKNTK